MCQGTKHVRPDISIEENGQLRRIEVTCLNERSSKVLSVRKKEK